MQIKYENIILRDMIESDIENGVDELYTQTWSDNVLCSTVPISSASRSVTAMTPEFVDILDK